MVDAQNIPWYVQTLGQWVVALPLIRWAGLRAIDERVEAKLAPITETMNAMREDVAFIRGQLSRRVDDER